MGIEKEECYVMSCDNCKESYQEHHSGYSLFIDEAQLHESAEDWFIDTDPRNDSKGEICLCEKCHHFNDEDVLIIHHERFKSN